MHRSITADTNVYVSAFLSSGPPLQVVNMGRVGLIRIDTSEAILGELIRVLRAKFNWDAHRLQAAREQILRFAHRVEPARAIDSARDDPDDNRVLECAIEARSEFVVTADRHLLKLGEFEGVRIVNAIEFLRVSAGK